jgi:hypothetical protein
MSTSRLMRLVGSFPQGLHILHIVGPASSIDDGNSSLGMRARP